MTNITFDKIDVTGGFWKQKQELIRNVTMMNVYRRFCETGRFEGMKCDWKEGMPNKPHIFFDSDVAKWLESAAYLIMKTPDPELEAIVDETVDTIVENADENGYFNQYFLQFEQDKRFTNRDCHELYCLGHLIEAAVAYYRATGKDKLLLAMEKYVDYVIKVFTVDHSASFATPGHEEIELALVKLYDLSGTRKYLDLALYFINTRGTEEDVGRAPYNQSHLPVREQTTAEGHAVRAVYLYCAMADLAKRTGDEGLKTACEKLFDNITKKRMYVTGAIGSSSRGEAFSFDYDLPNIFAYAESCANLGLALFSRRMQELECDTRFADIAEKVIYNGFLSSLSLDGKGFFYENPLEIAPELRQRQGEHYPITQRVEVFGCSCCPPNITRFISSIGDFVYSVDGETLYVNQYMENKADFDIVNDHVSLEMRTEYPYDGKVLFIYHGKSREVAFRVPGWCDDYPVSGWDRRYVSDGQRIELRFNMPVRFVEADPRVCEDSGRCAVTRGPIVWCVEEADCGKYLRDLELDSSSPLTLSFDRALGVPCLLGDGFRHSIAARDSLYSFRTDSQLPVKIKLIPYFAFANRAECEMLIWLQIK